MFHEPYGANVPLRNWQTLFTTGRESIPQQKNRNWGQGLDKIQEGAEVRITTINHQNQRRLCQK